jgi:hypothetical protein
LNKYYESLVTIGSQNCDLFYADYALSIFPVTVQPSCYITRPIPIRAGGLLLMMISSHSAGKSVSGLDGEAAAQRLRGRVGTTVKVKLLDVFPYLELHSRYLASVKSILLVVKYTST